MRSPMALKEMHVVASPSSLGVPMPHLILTPYSMPMSRVHSLITLVISLITLNISPNLTQGST